jgi:ABC-2 type transport system permease protein
MGPRLMQVLGRLNPITPIVEAIRALFSGVIADSVVVQGFLTALVLAAVGLALGTRAMRGSLA